MKVHLKQTIIALMLCVVIVLTPILLYACGYIMPFNADGTPSERLLLRIEGDYGRSSEGWWYMPAFQDDISIEVCYGAYNETIIFTCSHRGYLGTGVSRQEEIGGVTFRAGSRKIPMAWNNGKVLPLKDALDQGWLTDEDIRKIADLYNGYWDVDWETYDGSFYCPGY